MSNTEQGPLGSGPRRENLNRAPLPRPLRLLQAALTAAFVALAAPKALAQEAAEEDAEQERARVSGSVTVESADVLPINVIVNEDPTLQGNLQVDRVIQGATFTLAGEVNFNLPNAELTRGQVSACVSRVFGELFAKGCFMQDVDLQRFEATTQQAIGILANEYGVLLLGDYNLRDTEHGQYVEAGHEFNFSLAGRDFTLTPILGHEPQDNFDYGYVTLTTPLGESGANLSFRVFGNENEQLDASVALSYPFGRREE